MRSITALAIVTLLTWSSSAFAQSPPAGPVLLRLPPSARTAALGNAWVAGRDHDVVFFNPAQLIGARPGFDLSITRHGPSSTMGSIASTFAAGRNSLTLGWGVQLMDFSAVDAPHPFAPDIVLAAGPANGFSTLMTVGGAFVLKGYRIGAAGKFVAEHVAALSGTPSISQRALMADLGVARNLLGGVAAASLQNLGASTDDPAHAPIPKQLLAGWSMTKPAGPLDVGLYGQVLKRDGWTAPSGGVEAGYSWIEGYTLTLRAGARRPETTTQRPFAFGAALTADRLTVEYAVQFFDGGRSVNGVTIRWR